MQLVIYIDNTTTLKLKYPHPENLLQLTRYLSTAKREDNRLGSVRLSICVFVRALPAEPFDLGFAECSKEQ